MFQRGPPGAWNCARVRKDAIQSKTNSFFSCRAVDLTVSPLVTICGKQRESESRQ